MHKTVGEFVAPHLPAFEFAEELVRRLVAMVDDPVPSPD